MLVWIFQTGEPLQIDQNNVRPMRAINLANTLVEMGHQVIIWSTDFYHQEKKHRFGTYKEIRFSKSIEIRLVPSPGYIKNVGIGRLWDHFILSRNLSKILSKEESKPDIGFVGYPPIESASVMVSWFKKNKISVVLDVKDQWPTIFVEAFPRFLRPIATVLFFPYFYLGRKVMRDATALSSITPSFLQWALSFGGRAFGRFDKVAPLSSLTSSINEADLIEAGKWWDSKGVFNDKRARFIFVGSHTRAFDMSPIRNAAMRFKDCQFVICGSGEHQLQWQSKFEGLKNVVFPGWVDRAKIKVLASRSMAALAPYKNSKDFQMSIPNKIIDYLSFGLPVLSPLLGEVYDLIKNQSVGMIYSEKDDIKLEDCIFKLKGDSKLASKLSKNAFHTYTSMFDHESIYKSLVKTLEAISRNGK